MTLGCQVVNFVWPGLLDDANQVGCVSEVTVMQGEATIFHVGALVEMVDSRGVE